MLDFLSHLNQFGKIPNRDSLIVTYEAVEFSDIERVERRDLEVMRVLLVWLEEKESLPLILR